MHELADLIDFSMNERFLSIAQNEHLVCSSERIAQRLTRIPLRGLEPFGALKNL